MMEMGSDSSFIFVILIEGNIIIGGKQMLVVELGINIDVSGVYCVLDVLLDVSKLLVDQQVMVVVVGMVMVISQQIVWDIGSVDVKKIMDKYWELMSFEERWVFDVFFFEEQFKCLVVFDVFYLNVLVIQQKWVFDGVYGCVFGVVISVLVGGVGGQGLGQLGFNVLVLYVVELIGKMFDLNKQSVVFSEVMQMLLYVLLGVLLVEVNGGKVGSGVLVVGGGEFVVKFLGDYYVKQNGGELLFEQVEQVRVFG